MVVMNVHDIADEGLQKNNDIEKVSSVFICAFYSKKLLSLDCL
jgi:hypothetical protein